MSVEIREQDGELDEVICKDVRLVHVEQMSDSHWWLGIDLADGRRVAMSFYGKTERSKVFARIDENT